MIYIKYFGPIVPIRFDIDLPSTLILSLRLIYSTKVVTRLPSKGKVCHKAHSCYAFGEYD